MKPLIIINFKAYERAFGNDAIKLAKEIDDFSIKHNLDIIITIPLSEVASIPRYTRNIKVFAQTAHSIDFGAHTGKVPLQALLHHKIKGILINHAENPTTLSEIEKLSIKAKSLAMEVLVSAGSENQAKALAHLKHIDYLAYEPPHLIGTKKSVSEVKAQEVKKTASYVKTINSNISFLVGAGIHSHRDIEFALWEGADGVFISSIIMQSPSPINTLEELLRGWL